MQFPHDQRTLPALVEEIVWCSRAGKCNAGSNPMMVCMPSRGSRNTPSCFMRPDIGVSLMGHLAHMQT